MWLDNGSRRHDSCNRRLSAVALRRNNALGQSRTNGSLDLGNRYSALQVTGKVNQLHKSLEYKAMACPLDTIKEINDTKETWKLAVKFEIFGVLSTSPNKSI